VSTAALVKQARLQAQGYGLKDPKLRNVESEGAASAFLSGLVDEIRVRAYYPPTREMFNISDRVKSVTWTEAKGQAAVSASMVLDNTDLSAATHLNRPGMVVFFETRAEGFPFRERYRWIVWESTVTDRVQGTMSWTLFDHLIYLATAETSVGYKRDKRHRGGWTASEIAAHLLKHYKIPVISLARTRYKIPYFVLPETTIYDAVAKAYSIDRRKSGRYYYIVAHKGQVRVRRARKFEHLFVLNDSRNIRQAEMTRGLNDYAQGIIPRGGDTHIGNAASLDDLRFIGDPPLLAGGKYVYPLASPGDLIGTPYNGTHTIGNWQSDNAIDLGVANGTPVLAVGDGVVERVAGSYGDGSSQFDGFQVTIKVTNGNRFFYTHLMKCGVTAGQQIKAGQQIGQSGSANSVPHLHIAVEQGNPETIFVTKVHTAGRTSARRAAAQGTPSKADAKTKRRLSGDAAKKNEGAKARKERNRMAAAMLFGAIEYRGRTAKIRDPDYTARAAQALADAMSRASKTIHIVADGNMLVRQGDLVYTKTRFTRGRAFVKELYVSQISQTLTEVDHVMDVTLAWREREVSVYEDFSDVLENAKSYKELANSGATPNADGALGGQGVGGWYTTEASFFTDPPPGAGNLAAPGFHYAELGTASGETGLATGVGYMARLFGMGGELPMGFKVEMEWNGKTAILDKQDRGWGSGDPIRTIDLYGEAAYYFGLEKRGAAMVRIRPAQ
jgi:murein DD-endopeptidase MepM/ murein hydrolase activator NlpD